MAAKKPGMDRRQFLKRSAGFGLGALAGPSLARLGWAASKDRVTILQSVAADSLNPYAHSASPTYGIWQHFFDPLVEVDYASKEFYGVLAESWEFQGQKWVFRLKKGVRFHDGSPFTSKDVIHSITRMRDDKRSLQRENFREVTEMRAPDDHTVIITTEKPMAVLLDRLHNRFMLSKAAADKYGDQVDARATGTGPYKFVSFQRDGNMVMTRNDDYWGPKPEIKEVIYKKVAEEAARVAGLLAGQGDVINNVSVEEIPRLDQHPRVRVEKVAGLRMYFLAMNAAMKPFDNKLFRQAVSHSVDPQAIIKYIYDGNGYLTGWAYNDAIGWISFTCNHTNDGTSPPYNTNECITTNYGVTINSSSGDFSGWAWNDIVGWISFNCNQSETGNTCGVSDYKVETIWNAVPISGNLTSSVFDSQASGGAAINSIMWQGALNNGEVKFQIASAATPTGPWEYKGPGGTSSDTDTYNPGGPDLSAKINLMYHNNQRYFRYKIFLYSDSGKTQSPLVEDVLVNWSP